MPKIMLIDAAQPEETRIAIMDGKRLEDFDIESVARKQLKGNVYLAKVTRVEPSLQAAFVDYGGNRHGFLPFSEIHPDYYRIPVEDREKLLAEQEELRRQMQEEAQAREERELAAAEAREQAGDDENASEETDDSDDTHADSSEVLDDVDGDEDTVADDGQEEMSAADTDEENSDTESKEDGSDAEGDDKPKRGRGGRGRGRGRRGRGADRKQDQVVDQDGEEEDSTPQLWKRMRKSYKIQEVIKRGQIMLIQVVKEERGNKGAAVTSYVTMPGRYCVLMPNSPQSGGVSRKVASHQDRRKMRDILDSMDVPDGMSVILRTAGVDRTKIEIKRDLDYLMRLWDMIRDTTMKSSAPALIHEEGSLVKRAIRDHYTKDIDEVIVAGDEAMKVAKDVMKMMMPSHVRRVKQYKEPAPLFIKYGAEPQIDAMHSNTVTLRSGGYLVINPTEALVSIDINSGRATRERHIEETALKTNLEAADEIARQLRLRDLGGLVVIDFIDMENRRHNSMVEKRMRDALATDRARVQQARISQFGLMEISRQRLRPSLTETHFQTCPHCQGLGIVRTTEATALAVLRGIEAVGMEGRAGEIQVTLPEDVALFLFNTKRASLAQLEERYEMSLVFTIVPLVEGDQGFEIDVAKSRRAERLPAIDAVVEPDLSEDDDSGSDADEENSSEKETDKERDTRRSRGGRNRRGRRGGRDRNRKNEDGSSAEKNGNAIPADEEAIDDNIGNRKASDDTDVDGNGPEKSRDKPARKRSPRSRKKPESALPKTNDDAPVQVKETKAEPQEPAPARDYEVVNEVSGDKKKGWWKSLTG